MTRKIYFVSGARSDFDILLPVARAVEQAGVRAGWIYSAAQLSPFHGGPDHQGSSAEGIPIVGRIPSLLAGDSWLDRGLSINNLLGGLMRFLDWDRPDIVVVAGDHEEQFAGAFAASVLQIPVAHIFGGDRCVASEWDEVLRPVISKLSHFHFTASEEHRQRLIAMGERPQFVWNTGGPNLDVLLDTDTPPIAELARKYDFELDEGYVLFIMHPTPMFSDEGPDALEATLDAALEHGLRILASYPNTDPENYAYRQVLEEKSARNSLLRLHHNLPREDWVGLYRHARAIVGNSSSIVIESTLLGVPGLLIGRRQDFRASGENVIRVAANFEDVRSGLREVLTPEFRARASAAESLYGDGASAPRIAEILSNHPLDEALLQKMMTY